MGLLGRRHARHVEVGDPQRGRRRAREVVVAPLAAEARHRRRGVREAAEQVDRALVPAEVVDRTGDLAVLDQVDAVAGQPGEQQRSAGRPPGCTTCRSAAARRSVPATRSSTEPAPPSTSRTRLSIAGVVGCLVISAVCRVWRRAVELAVCGSSRCGRAPARCRRPSSRWRTPRRWRTARTAARRTPGRSRASPPGGSSSSPIRVPAPCRLKTDCPSQASRAPASQ